MAAWALDCAERVLPLFQAARPQDDRPRRALEAGRAWVQTGEFSMATIRAASLNAHAAAKDTDDSAAIAAAHAAGQAVATAHVPQHAYGGAYYALRAIAAQHPTQQLEHVNLEREWQAGQLSTHLRAETMDRIVVEQTPKGLRITIRKGADF
jgi:hypothetical protein